MAAKSLELSKGYNLLLSRDKLSLPLQKDDLFPSLALNSSEREHKDTLNLALIAINSLGYNLALYRPLEEFFST